MKAAVATWVSTKHKKMNKYIKEVEEEVVELYEIDVNEVFNEKENISLRILETSKRKMLDWRGA